MNVVLKFTKEMYLKKIEEALNTPIEQLSPSNVQSPQALQGILAAARNRSKIKPVGTLAQ